MIKQHYYTRERHGIYSSNPGYNTVAKSENLSDDFVKNLLQDYCFYEIPLALLNEKDYSKFPKAYTCFNSLGGELVLGSSCFIPKDYEGQRSTYFTHNYVIDKSEKDIFIKNPEKIVYASGFNYSFDIEKSNVLEQVKTIGIDSFEDVFFPCSDLLKEIKINEKTFKQIIMACLMSVLKNKKIYIILDVDISLISKYAKGLLKYVYISLPYAIRREIGFVTYAKDIKSKKYINIQFLPQGALKNIGTEVSAGFLFDFALNRFLTEGLDIEKHKYLDFIWENIEDKKQLNIYMDFVEEFICLNKFHINKFGINKFDINKFDINELDELCELLEDNRNATLEDYKDFKIQKVRDKEKAIYEKFKCFIERLDIDKMSIEDIIKMELKAILINSENYEIIYLMKQVIAVNCFNEVKEVSKVIASSFCKSKLESLIKNLYKDNYFFLMCAFSEIREESISIDIKGIILFIYENRGVEEARKFLVWLCSNVMDIVMYMGIDIEVIKESIREYIDLYDNKIFTDKDRDKGKGKNIRDLLMEGSNKELREFLKKEEYKRTKGIRKIVLRYFK